MPCDQRPTDEQLVNANKLLSGFTGLLRRKVNPEASQSIGFGHFVTLQPAGS